jgi:hypothetical protein
LVRCLEKVLHLRRIERDVPSRLCATRQGFPLSCRTFRKPSGNKGVRASAKA